ncbi:MAG TPA: MFS transporter [Chloroflexia bacterium]|nr:MFS transporter [Chloroflexia bacterium]
MTTRGQPKRPASRPKQPGGGEHKRPAKAPPGAARALRGLRQAPATVREKLPLLRPGVLRRGSEPTVEGLTPEAALHASSNFRKGVLNGVVFTMIEALIAPSLVLAWYINGLGAPNALVGLLPAILAGGWFLPQMFVASRVQGRPYMKAFYRNVGIARALFMAVLAVLTVVFAAQPVVLLVVFFAFFTLYSFSAGISGIPWYEMISKTISPRRRGTFFGLRNFWGGLVALGVAAPVGAIMSEQIGLAFPYNFALIFGLTAAAVLVGVYAWSSIHEPAAATTAKPMSVRQLFRRGREAFRTDRDYRSFMVARVLISLAAIADPFYVVYAKNVLGAPAATVGLYLGASSVASLLSNFFWSPLSDRASNRTVMTMTVLATALVPLTAVAISLFVGQVDNTFLFTSFTLVFVLGGLAVGASRIVNNNMLLTVAPPAELATYVGFLNTVLGVVIFVPVLGGLLTDLVGYEPLFLTSVGLAGLSLIAATKMSTRRPV